MCFRFHSQSVAAPPTLAPHTVTVTNTNCSATTTTTYSSAATTYDRRSQNQGRSTDIEMIDTQDSSGTPLVSYYEPPTQSILFKRPAPRAGKIHSSRNWNTQKSVFAILPIYFCNEWTQVFGPFCDQFQDNFWEI